MPTGIYSTTALRAENEPTAADGKNDDIRKHTPAKLSVGFRQRNKCAVR